MSNATMSNARMTFDQIMALSEQQDPIPAEDVAPGGAPARSRTVSMEVSLDLNRKLQLVSNPAIPVMAAKLKQPAIKKKMDGALDTGRVQPIGAIPRDRLDPRVASKKQQSLANFSTNEMVFTHFGKDGAMLAYAKQLTLDSFEDEREFDAFIEALNLTTQSIGSSGTMNGLLTRLVGGMTAAPVPRLGEAEYLRYARMILRYHTIDLDFVGRSVKEIIDEVRASQDFTFNTKSSAGVPYYKKVGDPGVLPKAVEMASALLNAYAEGSLNTLHSERPALFAVMLKNKQDIYELAKLDNKIRPYFVYPLHERLLYSLLQCRLKAVRFDEDADACSAVGFSWNYGGGDRMYRWIVSRVKKGPGFYSTLYGDDQLWVIVLTDGSAFICTPDFSHMDLSLAPVWGKVAYQLWRKSFTKIDKTWASVLKMNCHRAFTRPVLIDGALAYLFKYGLGSGIPGTTKFDEVASASVNGYVKEQYELVMSKVTNKEQLEVWLNSLIPVIRDQFGLVFKEGSMDVTAFEQDQQSYDFVFLGQTLVRVRGLKHYHYIPKPSLSRLLLSATTYKKSYSSVNTRQRSTASKLRSLYAGGGFLYPALGEVLGRYFEVLDKAGVHPFNGDEVEGDDETESDILFRVDFIDQHWPTEDWCLNLYLPPDDQVAEHTGVSVQGRTNEAHVTELVDFSMDIEGFTTSEDEEVMAAMAKLKMEEAEIKEALEPSSWVAQEALERLPMDRGADPVKNPQTVATRYQTLVQPLPQEQKDAFERAREEERQKIREQRGVSQGKVTAPMKKKGKVQTGAGKRSGAAIHEGDFDYYEDDEQSD